MNKSNNEECNLDNLTKKQFKKWCKKNFGSHKESIPKAPKNLFMAKNGWVAA